MKYTLVKNKITFENGVEFTMSGDIVNNFSLRKKDTLTKEEYREILLASCKEYSIYLLSIKDYFKKDIYLKLVDRYRDREVARIILEDLEERGYIDDYSLAKIWVESHKKYGTKKIEFQLFSKGIDSETIKELTSDDEVQLEEIEKFLEKNKSKELEKNITSLMRKGFQYKDIKKVVDRRK